MTFRPEHELHRRRFGRNLGVGVTLGAFVLLVVALTMAKITTGDSMEGFDHAPRGSVLPPVSQ